MGLTAIGTRADDRRAEPPPTKEATCKTGLCPPKELTVIGGRSRLHPNPCRSRLRPAIAAFASSRLLRDVKPAQLAPAGGEAALRTRPHR